jgi:hypothetical protein
VSKKKTGEEKILELAFRLAGPEKISQVGATADRLMAETGKSPARALADALELHKCPNTFPDIN